MPEGRFNEYSAQEQTAKAREWLTTRGLPMTAQNLNRAMAALHTGQDTPSAADTTERVNRNIDRTERRPAQSRSGTAGNRTGDGNRAVAGGSNIVNATPTGTNPPAQATDAAAPTVAATTAPAAVASNDPFSEVMSRPDDPPENGGPAMAGPRAMRNAEVPMTSPPRRVENRGTVNGAVPIDMYDPAGGMFAGNIPRQADESGVDPIGLAIALGIPLAGGLAMGARAGAAAQDSAAMLRNFRMARGNNPGATQFGPPAPPQFGPPFPTGGVPGPTQFGPPMPAAAVPRGGYSGRSTTSGPGAAPPGATSSGGGFNPPNPGRSNPMEAVSSGGAGWPASPGPPPAVAPVIPRSWAGTPNTQMPRAANGPRRGQQPTPDNAPTPQPNTSNVRRNPTRSLRDQLARNRLEQQIR